jgi:hypothetical protein
MDMVGNENADEAAVNRGGNEKVSWWTETREAHLLKIYLENSKEGIKVVFRVWRKALSPEDMPPDASDEALKSRLYRIRRDMKLKAELEAQEARECEEQLDDFEDQQPGAGGRAIHQ